MDRGRRSPSSIQKAEQPERDPLACTDLDPVADEKSVLQSAYLSKFLVLSSDFEEVSFVQYEIGLFGKFQSSPRKELRTEKAFANGAFIRFFRG